MARPTKTSEHTPGQKWWVRDSGSWGELYICTRAGVVAICKERARDDAEAIAAEIVNACNAHEDLLAACEAALEDCCPEWCRDFAERHKKDPCDDCEYLPLRKKVEAAIAKARGGRDPRTGEHSRALPAEEEENDG